VLLLFTASAMAEDRNPPSAPQLGTRVRVEAAGVNRGTTVGYLTAADETSITVTQKGGGTVRLPVSSITAVSASTGRVRRRWWIGAGAGAALGLLAAQSWGFYKPDPGEECVSMMYPNFQCTSNPTQAKALVTLAFAVAGATVQAARWVDRWEPVSLEELKRTVISASALRSDRAVGPEPPKSLDAHPMTASSYSPIASPLLGTRIRFRLLDGKKIAGELSFLSTAEAKLLVENGSERSVLRATIGSSESSGGRKSRWKKGLVIGAVLGLGIGLLPDHCTEMTSQGLQPCTSTTDRVGGSMAMGATVGAALGLLLTKETWRPLSLDAPGDAHEKATALSLRPILGLSERKAGLAFRVSW
jgi:hypothetical protein